MLPRKPPTGLWRKCNGFWNGPVKGFGSQRIRYGANGCGFDTRRMAQAFENAGFTPLKARVLTEMFQDTQIKREQENRELLASKGDYMQVKTELRILEKSDFHLLRSDHEHLETNIEKNIARVNTELERIENRAIKYVLGSSFFLGVLGYVLWFFYQNTDLYLLSPFLEDEGFMPTPKGLSDTQ